MTLYQPYRYKLRVAKTKIHSDKTSNSTYKGLSRKKKRKIKLAAKLRLKQKRKERAYKNRVPKKYKVYIKSKYWTERKNQYYRKFGRKCAVCFSSKYIDLHHMVYGNYGFERDEFLVPLCREHHGAFHAEVGVKQNMLAETHTFIQEQQELLEFPFISS